MGFSSHEIYMILRARNEAGSVLQRFSRVLAGHHGTVMDQYKQQMGAINDLNNDLRNNSSEVMSNARRHALANKEKIAAVNEEIGAVNNRLVRYRDTHNKEMAMLGEAKRIRQDAITMHGIEAREMGRASQAIKAEYNDRIKKIQSLQDIDKVTSNAIVKNLRNTRDTAVAANEEIRKGHLAIVDELRKENVAIGQNEQRIAKNAKAHIKRQENIIGKHKETIAGFQKETDEVNKAARAAVEADNQQIASNKALMRQLKQEAAHHQAKLNKLQGLGEAYMIAGTSAIIAGGMMVAGFVDAGKAAIEYEKTASLTFTQVDRDAQGHALVTKEAIVKMGKDVARQWPVEFSAIQPAMYDIFSSMDIKSAEVADQMVQNIAKAAVAGGVAMDVAGKGIIEVINAWGMSMDDAASSAQTLNRVNDVAFTLVKEGVGSYEQFSNAIGRSIPSAVKAGATYEDMAGGLAFLTRMGMSTAMASTSMGRAFDLIANPRFAKNMKKYGLEVADANGNIRPMTDIVNTLKGHMQGMTEVEASAFLKDVTLGAGGTVQAMRFLSHAVHDDANMFGRLTDEMRNASEAGGTVVGTAYDIMANTPSAKIQELSNQFEVFRITVGDTLLEAIKPVIDALTQMFDWFNNLPSGVQNTIIIITAVVAGLLTLGGIVMLVAGFFFMFKAAVIGAGLTMGAVLGPIGLVIAGIVALIAIIVAVVYFWPQISAAAGAAWDAIVAWWTGLPAWFQGLWDSISSTVVNWANSAIAAAGTFWNDLVTWFTNIPTMAQAAWDALVAAVVGFFVNAGAAVSAGVAAVAGFFQSGADSWLAPVVYVFEFMAAVIDATWNTIKTLVAGAFLIIVGIFTGNGKLIQDAWNAMGRKLLEIWNAAGQKIHEAFNKMITNVVTAVMGFVLKVVNGFNDMRAKAVAKMLEFAIGVGQKINDVVKFFSELPGKAIAAAASLGAKLATEGAAWLARLSLAVTTGLINVVNFFVGLPGRVVGALSGFAGQMNSVGSNIIDGLIAGIVDMAGRAAQAAINAVKGAVEGAKRFLGIASPSKVFTAIGVWSGEGLAMGLDKMQDTVEIAGTALAQAAISPVEFPLDSTYSVAKQHGFRYNTDNPNAQNYQEINIEINTEEIDPVKHAADLGYEIGSRLGI